MAKKNEVYLVEDSNQPFLVEGQSAPILVEESSMLVEEDPIPTQESKPKVIKKIEASPKRVLSEEEKKQNYLLRRYVEEDASVSGTHFQDLHGDIVIPDGVTRIGSSAFRFCSRITSISIPDSVTSIGENAFADCSNLTSVTIPDSVTCIGDYAFQFCSSLKSIYIPTGINSIGKNAFQGCSNLKSITIPDSVTNIGDSAFQECTSVESVKIAGRGATIERNAFQGCSKLTAINLSMDVAIGNDAFDGCYSLERIIVPHGTLKTFRQMAALHYFITFIEEAEITPEEKVAEEEARRVAEAIARRATEERLRRQRETDQIAANQLMAVINAIGEVEYSYESYNEITAARHVYNRLSDAQKELVENIDVLTSAEEKYANLRLAAEKATREKAEGAARNKTQKAPKSKVTSKPKDVKEKKSGRFMDWLTHVMTDIL